MGGGQDGAESQSRGCVSGVPGPPHLIWEIGTEHSPPLEPDSFVPGEGQTLSEPRVPDGETEAPRESA